MADAPGKAAGVGGKEKTHWKSWFQRNAIPLILLTVALLGLILAIALALEPCSVVIIPGKVIPAALVEKQTQTIVETTTELVEEAVTTVTTPTDVDVVLLLDKSGSLLGCRSPTLPGQSCWFDLTSASETLLTELSQPGSPLTTKRTKIVKNITGREVQVTTESEVSRSYYLPDDNKTYTLEEFEAIIKADGRAANLTESTQIKTSTKTITRKPRQETSFGPDVPMDSLRAAVISWSEDVTIDFGLNESLAKVTTGVGKLPLPEGYWTYYALALSQCFVEIEKNGRPGAKSVCVLESDGAPTDNSGDIQGTPGEPYEEGKLGRVPGARQVLDFCVAKKITPCTGVKVADFLKEQGVIIIGVYIGTAGSPEAMLPYISCEGQTSDTCPFFLETDFSTLQATADELTKQLVNTGKPVTGKPVSQAPQKSQTSDVSPPVTSRSNATLGASRKLPSQESCINDPNVWWVLLLFLPLLAYMLYRPCSLMFAKQRMVATRKETLRNSTTLEELDAAMDAMKAANAPDKRRYKWSIAAADSYLWNMGGAGATPMPVNFGAKAPPSAPKKDASKFMYKREPAKWEPPTRHDHYETIEMQPGDFDYEYTVMLMRCFPCLRPVAPGEDASMRGRMRMCLVGWCSCCFTQETRFDNIEAGQGGQEERPQIETQGSHTFEIPELSGKKDKPALQMQSSQRINLAKPANPAGSFRNKVARG